VCSPLVKDPTNGEQNTNLIPFIRHGQAPGSGKSGDTERGATEGAPSQPCAPQPVRGQGLLRASLRRLPTGVQPTSNSAANPDSCAGVEAVAEALVQKGICMNRAISLRRDLAERAQKYAQAEGLPHCLSYGEAPNVCFLPYADDSRHGNFLQGSYQAIKADPEWLRRLAKVHTRGRQSLPNTERRWMELDSSTSSDALLMNIFCHPTVKRDGRLAALLGAEPGASACFGYKARVPWLTDDLIARKSICDWGICWSKRNSPRVTSRVPRKKFSWHIAISRKSSMGSNCLKSTIVIFPTSLSEMCSRLMHCNVHSAF